MNRSVKIENGRALVQEFHRINKESLTAERAGNRPHSRPLIISHHTPASPANSARIPARFPTRRSPPPSGPFRSFPHMGHGMGQPHPGGDGPPRTARFSSKTNKNQPDRERSELIFCWISPTALAGKGFEPHDLRVMRWYQKYYSEQ